MRETQPQLHYAMLTVNTSDGQLTNLKSNHTFVSISNLLKENLKSNFKYCKSKLHEVQVEYRCNVDMKTSHML